MNEQKSIPNYFQLENPLKSDQLLIDESISYYLQLARENNITPEISEEHLKDLRGGGTPESISKLIELIKKLELENQAREVRTLITKADRAETFQISLGRSIHTVPNPYSILGLEIEADISQIKTAYRNLQKVFTAFAQLQAIPEKFKTLQNKATSVAQKINDVYSTLSDPAQRLKIDTILRESKRIESSDDFKLLEKLRERFLRLISLDLASADHKVIAEALGLSFPTDENQIRSMLGEWIQVADIINNLIKKFNKVGGLSSRITYYLDNAEKIIETFNKALGILTKSANSDPRTSKESRGVRGEKQSSNSTTQRPANKPNPPEQTSRSEIKFQELKRDIETSQSVLRLESIRDQIIRDRSDQIISNSHEYILINQLKQKAFELIKIDISTRSTQIGLDLIREEVDRLVREGVIASYKVDEIKGLLQTKSYELFLIEVRSVYNISGLIRIAKEIDSASDLLKISSEHKVNLFSELKSVATDLITEELNGVYSELGLQDLEVNIHELYENGLLSYRQQRDLSISIKKKRAELIINGINTYSTYDSLERTLTQADDLRYEFKLLEPDFREIIGKIRNLVFERLKSDIDNPYQSSSDIRQNINSLFGKALITSSQRDKLITLVRRKEGN